MPPHGLYPIPRHHLYDAYKPRPSFNTMDFKDDNESQNETALGPSAQNSGMSEVPHEGQVKEQKQKKRKKHSRIKHETSSVSGKEETTRALRPGPKKQRRESEGKTYTPALTHTTLVDGFVVGGDILQSLETSMSNIGESFKYLTSAPKDTFELQDDSKKSKKKKDAAAVPSVPLAQKAGDPKAKKQGMEGIAAVHDQSKIPRTLNASPVVNLRHGRGLRRSYVPLPPPRRLSAFAISKKAKQQQQECSQDSKAISSSKISQATKDKGTHRGRGSTPFLKSSFSDALRAAIQPSQEQPATPILSSLSSDSNTDSDTQTSILELVQPQRKSRKMENQYGLSTATRKRMLNMEPLADKPNSRHHSSSNSAITSFPSSGSSTTLPFSLDRVGMPYARSGAAIDPFTHPEKQIKKKRRETHEEASAVVFGSKFSAVQKTVNFSDEQEYLDIYLSPNIKNHDSFPFPCLGKITGCTAKKVQILRAGKQKDETTAHSQEVRGSDLYVMNDVNFRAYRAEEFLVTAVRSRVPVPVGHLAGIWKLFSPKYFEHNFDRYALGSRTLTIHDLAGSDDPVIFNARLNIPPHSKTFVISTFTAPPHASFRTTTLKTFPENYSVSVVFLGNGYMRLRFDPNLLLHGKPTKMVKGKNTYMEFVGVHNKALQWVDEKDELEEECKKLFGKYGGMDDD